ncbi:MAG: glycosyltransferase family 2 protein [Balneolaceae bacterium]|nr:MAG: glycosyltransferase family 2 protein [Balneolaceae bacterium]
MVFKLSVIICTHNPVKEFLSKTLEGLKQQDLPVKEWELVVVDNASDEAVSKRWNLDWHPNGRIITEPELGLTPARVRGIRETSADLLIYVDDDMILDPDYLSVALSISDEYPFLGIWGGNLKGGFEVEPPQTIMRYVERLAVREVKRERWSNIRLWETTPSGAGMVLRRVIAEEYANEALNHPLKKFLSRKGDSLSSGGEVDIAFKATGMGFGSGLFPQLSATHLLPAHRLTESYMLRLQEANAFSGMVISSIYGEGIPVAEKPSLIPLRKLIHIFTGKSFRLKMTLAALRGQERAMALLKEIEENEEALWKLHSLRL